VIDRNQNIATQLKNSYCIINLLEWVQQIRKYVKAWFGRRQEKKKEKDYCHYVTSLMTS
jgi:hypothetical protein